MAGRSIGLVGLGVMGENLALNVERNGFPIAVYNRTWERTEAFLGAAAAGKNVHGARTLAELVLALERPRKVLLMVKAGGPVDAVLAELVPLLERGDVVIDGGNSHPADTERRLEEMTARGIRYVGMGVSGGEEGALWGPSLMPGGDREAWELLEPILTRIAAKTASGPCVTWVGRGGAGHFVKMVHNGIEYGDMQLIAEAYDLMRHGLGLSTGEIAAIFAAWNRGELASFLVEITAAIVDFPDDLARGRARKPLIDRIVDAAGQKGTGKWTTQTAMDAGVAIPTITAAVDMRFVSAIRGQRERAAKTLGTRVKPVTAGRKAIVARIAHALWCAKVCSYAQGFDLIRRSSVEQDYGIDPAEVARIWTGGCIIRAALLDDIRAAFTRDAELPNLVLDRAFAAKLKKRSADWRAVMTLAMKLGMTPAATSASLAWFDAFRRARLPANLIQAQRDYFGAHTYERIDRPGAFHTEWSAGREHAPGNGRAPDDRAPARKRVRKGGRA